MNNSVLNNLKSDIPASIVVFFVAIPLCLGIALASGAPLFSGIIAGIIGGIVVGLLSGSQIGVSGPAAGLAAIVLTAISTLNGFENFLLAVVIGGLIQLTFGILKAGVIGQYFPSSVIKGMLTGIGLIIFIKQIPYFFGNKNLELGSNMLSEISLGSTLVGIIGLFILILWESVLSKKAKIFQLVQGPLVAVIVGIIYTVTMSGNEKWGIVKSNLVDVPVPGTSISIDEGKDFASGPNEKWTHVLTAALVSDGVSSQGDQTFTMNITSLPEGGANYRVFKTTANGGSFFGNATALTLGENTFTVGGVDFDRAVKFQFSSGDVEFDALSLNGENSNCVTNTSSVGLEALDAQYEIKLFPNPTSNDLTISLEGIDNVNIVVIDIQGKILLQQSGLFDKDRINLSSYQSGVYFVKIMTPEESTEISVIKQ